MFRSALFAAVLAAVQAPAVASDDQPAKRLDMAKVLVAQMAAGQFDKAVEPFDQTMKRALPADKLKEVWDGLTKQYGQLQRATETRTEKIQQYEVVYVTCEFQHGKLDAKVVFSIGEQGRRTFLRSIGEIPAAILCRSIEVRGKGDPSRHRRLASSRHSLAAEGRWPLPGRDPGAWFWPP